MQSEENSSSESGLSVSGIVAMSVLAFFKVGPAELSATLNKWMNSGARTVRTLPAHRVARTGPAVHKAVINQGLLSPTAGSDIRDSNAEDPKKKSLNVALKEVKLATGRIHFDWALGEVKNQRTEGACTAFALTSALEALLMARYQIEATIDPLRFWNSYALPDADKALAAAGGHEGALVAVVKKSSRFHPYPAGARLEIRVPKNGSEMVSMDKLPALLAQRYPVLFSSYFDKYNFEKLPSGKMIVPAVRAESDRGHMVVLSGMNSELGPSNQLWLQVRNSWGRSWGKEGNAYVNAKHCVKNICTFHVIKNVTISLSKLNYRSSFADSSQMSSERGTFIESRY